MPSTTLSTALEPYMPASMIPDVLEYIITCQAKLITKLPAAKPDTDIGETRRRGRPSNSSAGAARTPSKAAMAIIAVMGTNPTGWTRTAIAKMLPASIKADRVAPTLATMAKANLVYKKGSQWFTGPAPAGIGATTTATVRKKAANTGPSLSDVSLQAVRALPAGSTTTAITDYINKNLGMKARSNHVGVALARHATAGRIMRMGEKPNFTYSIPLAAAG